MTVGNQAGGQTSQVYYKFNVPSGQARLEIKISGGIGDCDLYVRRGSLPTLSTYDYRPFLAGNSETVKVNSPAGDDWFIMLHGFAAYAGVTLSATAIPPWTPPWTNGVSLTGGRNAFGAVVGGDGKLYVIGGQNVSNTVLNLVERFDEGTQAWETVASLPSPISRPAVTRDQQGRVYAIGGYTGAALLSSVLRFESAGNYWTNVSNLPVPLSLAKAVTDSQGLIYIVGGSTNLSGTASGFAARFDPSTGTWTALPSLNTPRVIHEVLIDAADRIYAIGGTTGSGETGTVERFDPTQPSLGWVFVNPMPTPRQVQGAVGPDGLFYLCGGWTPGYTALVERYDPVTGNWAADYPSMNQARNNHAVAATPSGRVYALGGDNGNTSVEFTTSPLRAPSFITQQANRIVVSGTTLILRAAAIGTGPLAYQWRFNEADIPGATNATLVIPAPQPSDSGRYSVVSRNAAGSAVSTLYSFSFPLQTALNPSTQDTVLFTGTGSHGQENETQAVETYGGRIYYVVHSDGTNMPSKVTCYDPMTGTNEVLLSASANQFWSLKAMQGLLFISHINGRLWRYDGATTTEITSTPFTATNYVSSMAEFGGRMYFATSSGTIHVSTNGFSFTLVATIGGSIYGLQEWKGQLYGVNSEFYSYSAKIFRTADGVNWTILNTNAVYSFHGLLAAPNHLYAVSVDNADGASLGIRATTNGTVWTQVFFTSTEAKNIVGRNQLFSQDGRAYFSSEWGGVARLFPVFEGLVEPRQVTGHAFSSVVELNGRLFGIGAQSSNNRLTAPYVISLLGSYSTNLLVPPAAGQQLFYSPGNGHYYQYVSNAATWPAAKADAESRVLTNNYRGHLATIQNASENDLVLSLSPVVGGWLGGLQPSGSVEPGEGWQWITGEPFSYVNWNSGEPNNSGALNEESLNMLGTIHGTPAKWNDVSGTSTSGYIVEFELGAPVILVNPQSQIATPGATISFYTTVVGASSLRFQWRKNGFDINGATNSTLVLYDILVSQAGDYSVQVTNTFGSVTSSNANLTVTASVTLNAPALLPAGFQLQLTGPTGTYDFQASTNLMNWTTLLTTNLTSGGTRPFTDANASLFQRRFYRVILR
jgi:hypothetical protein